MSVQKEIRDSERFGMTSLEVETREQTGNVTECTGEEGKESTMIESEARLMKAKGPPAVPLRLRQLPASFWQEPNRPKYQLQPFPFSLALAQEYKSVLPVYKDLNVFDLNYNSSILGHSSAPSAPNRGYSMAEYLYYNYAAKYQSSPAKVPDFSWTHGLSSFDNGNKITQRTLPGFSSTLFPSASSTMSSSPSSSSSQNRLCINGSYPCSPVTCSGLHPGQWEGVTLGQYPSHTLPQGLSPWRPVPTKSSTSYSTRFHPFAV